MEKPSVKFRTPSQASTKSEGQRSLELNESLNTTRQRFLTAPEIPISDAETKKREQIAKEKEKERKKKKKKKGKQLKPALDDDDIDGKRVQELQERHMRAMDDFTKLRNHYYHEYKNVLDAKVIQQRRDIQKKSDELKRKIEMKRLQEIEASHHVKKRLAKSAVNLDNTFLKNLPKTRMYKIMALQSKLMKEGRFTCIEDIDTFWDRVQQSDPDIFQQMFDADGGAIDDDEEDGDDARSQGSHHSAGSDGDKASSVGSLHHYDRIDGGHSLFSIEEDKEPRRSSIKQNSVNGHRASIGQNNSRQKFYRKPVHPKVAEMEQKYPRVEFPEMLALHMDLDPPKEDPEVVAIKEDFQMRARERAKEKKRLRKMYEMSLTHQASTQRLIDKNEDFSNVMDSLHISDVGGMLQTTQEPQQELDYTPYNYPSLNPALPLPPTTHRSNSLTPALLEISKLLGETIPEEREEDVLSGRSTSTKRRKSSKSKYTVERDGSGSRTSSAGSTQSRTRSERHLEPIVSRKSSGKAAPLNMDSVKQDQSTVVKDVMCLSTLWTNYARDLPTVR
ncbi:uncharacterized protein [Amphiura filiformis]|uniref:uncharacterized protein isoform X2 n=1 Tax=Amphiura filiformis TaxID=82378 RepID=UPI003B227927